MLRVSGGWGEWGVGWVQMQTSVEQRWPDQSVISGGMDLTQKVALAVELHRSLARHWS